MQYHNPAPFQISTKSNLEEFWILYAKANKENTKWTFHFSLVWISYDLQENKRFLKSILDDNHWKLWIILNSLRNFKNNFFWDWRDGSAVKRTGCFCRGPSIHMAPINRQWSVIPVPGNPALFSDLSRYYTTWMSLHTCSQYTIK